MDLPIDKETFVGAKDERHYRQLEYDMLAHIAKKQTSCRASCDQSIEGCATRITLLEKRKIFNTVAAATGGFFGGIAAIVGKFLLGKA